MRDHKDEFISRILFRAIRETKDLNKSSIILSGDTCGDNLDEQINNMLKVYKLTMSECLRIQAFILGNSKEL